MFRSLSLSSSSHDFLCHELLEFLEGLVLLTDGVGQLTTHGLALAPPCTPYLLLFVFRTHRSRPPLSVCCCYGGTDTQLFL